MIFKPSSLPPLQDPRNARDRDAELLGNLSVLLALLPQRPKKKLYVATSLALNRRTPARACAGAP
jgi:hypothetical protein